MTLAALCLVFMEVGRSADAITASRRAAVLFEETGDRRRKAEALMYLSEALATAGDTAKAKRAAHEAAAVLRAISGT